MLLLENTRCLWTVNGLGKSGNVWILSFSKWMELQHLILPLSNETAACCRISRQCWNMAEGSKEPTATTWALWRHHSSFRRPIDSTSGGCVRARESWKIIHSLRCIMSCSHGSACSLDSRYAAGQHLRCTGVRRWTSIDDQTWPTPSAPPQKGENMSLSFLSALLFRVHIFTQLFSLDGTTEIFKENWKKERNMCPILTNGLS